MRENLSGFFTLRLPPFSLPMTDEAKVDKRNDEEKKTHIKSE
jgi:hypothetical protein